MRKKVLFFLPGGVGGAERVTVTFAKLLDIEKYEVKIVVLGYSNSNISKFIPKDIPVIYLNIRRMRDNSLLKMYKILKQEKAEYAFASLRFVCINLLFINKYLIKNLKSIVRAQISPVYINNQSWHDRLLRFLYPTAHNIIAQTDEMQSEMMDCYGLLSDQVIVLQNPIDTNTINTKINAANPLNKNSYNYVSVGRCVHQKGYDILIESFAIVLRKKPQSKLTIVGAVGDDDYSKALKELIKEKGLSGKVILAGFSDNPYKYIKNSDCYVLSSRNEGLPNVLLDANYLKIPIVATSCIPIVDRIVENGINGLTVNIEDVNSLADGMLEISKLDYKESDKYVSAKPEDFVKLFM